MKANRKTRFEVRCRGTIIGYVDSYASIELEHEQLLHTASRAASGGGFCCMEVWNKKEGACKKLSVTPVSQFWEKEKT